MSQPVVDFSIVVQDENAQLLPELAERCKDFTSVFKAIITRWAEGNIRKFDEAAGKEGTGIEVDEEFGVFWTGLTEKYMKQKRRDYPDWLMVRTGDLMQELSDENKFFQAILPLQASFGYPMESGDKVDYNWDKRPAIFLDEYDRGTIDQIVFDYMGGNGIAAMGDYMSGPPTGSRKESADMQASFDNAMGGE